MRKFGYVCLAAMLMVCLITSVEAVGGGVVVGETGSFESSEDNFDPFEIINTLIAGLLESGDLNTGQANSLFVKVNAILKNLNKGKFKVAENVINAFTNEVSDFVFEGILSWEDGDALIEAANQLISQNIEFQNTYSNPVVVAFINSRNNDESVDVRVRYVTATGCIIFIEEPDNEQHPPETISYIVMEAGQWTLDGGIIVEAGTVDTTAVHRKGGSKCVGPTLTFSSFSSTPAVLHNLNSYNNADFMSSDVCSVSNTQFRIQQEAAETASPSTKETIAWIAFSTGSGVTNGSDYVIGRGSDGGRDGVDDSPHPIYYSFSTTPDIVVKGNSLSGNDGFWARGAGTYNSVQQDVYAEEDVIGDTERSHNNEDFAWAAFDPNTVFVTQ